MFRVFFTNMGYFSAREGFTLDEAVAIARDAGFEAGIWQGTCLVATWSIIGGLVVR